MYQIDLYYGYEETECGIFHAFIAKDPATSADSDAMGKKLAEMLDAEPDNPDKPFNWNSMLVELPVSVVERIKADAIREYAACARARATCDGTAEQNVAAYLQVIGAYQKAGQNRQICPRCGNKSMKQDLAANCYSRHADVYICNACGTDEAVRDFAKNPLPLTEWAGVKHLKK